MPLEGWPCSLATLWPMAAMQWLYCGLFITAHDACHNSVAPGAPRLNNAIGYVCAALYACFDFRALRTAHHAHHAHPGTAQDPDFNRTHANDARFWPWLMRFGWHYTSLRQWLLMAALSQVLMHGLGIGAVRVMLFWAVPAWLSAVQLFYFGTYLPHRPLADTAFADRHRSRDSGFGWWASLLTCYHFGYHEAHHQAPHVPWFKLPQARCRIEQTKL